MTLEKYAEERLDRLYSPRVPEESQASGWHKLKSMVQNGLIPNQDDLLFFHPLLRDIIISEWVFIKTLKTNKMTITHKSTEHYDKLYINGVLYISLPKLHHSPLQSYIDNETKSEWKYVIEIYLPERPILKLEYDTEEKWKTVLGELDNIL